jgi:hypothetical protein
VALQDYVAPDCRFLTIYRGQVVYVFSKLKGRGRLFWGGSVSLGRVTEGRIWDWGGSKPIFHLKGKLEGAGTERFGTGGRFVTYFIFTL